MDGDYEKEAAKKFMAIKECLMDAVLKGNLYDAPILTPEWCRRNDARARNTSATMINSVESHANDLIRKLLPKALREALHDMIKQDESGHEKTEDRYGSRMYTEGFEVVTLTYANKRINAAFMPEPDITPYQMYLCRKVLDGAIYGSKLAFLLEHRLMRHFGEIDLVNADQSPMRMKRLSNRFHYVPAEVQVNGELSDPRQVRVADTREGCSQSD